MSLSKLALISIMNKRELKCFILLIRNNNSYSLCFLWKMGGSKMNIIYNEKADLLYIRLDDRKQDVINRRVSEDIVLDIGGNNKIIGIEILDASKHLSLERILPVKYEVT